MIAPVTYWFNKWLTLMEEALNDNAMALNKKQFRELEEKIKAEIAYHRKRRPRRAL